MYTLLSGLYKYMFQKDEYCILILGLDNAGKTTFLEQSKTRFNKNYKGMSLSKITTTVGLNIGTVDFGKARLMFWDLGGQEELQSLWDKEAPPKGLPAGGRAPAAQRPVLLPPSTTPSATASSMSSTPRTRSGCPSPSKRSRRWSQARRWTVSPSWCWPTSRTLRLASPSLTSRPCSATAPPRSAGATS
ncbi:ADP-ribosylation factor-related protein 1 isoform X4 [Mesoplodon densirostris]|uniref:ADP-ribosylation factor-related protein 1 isoform X4 n=1 Tax=Mesoplodon densirostris TaxID=48708 RepID=UPI0028DBC038|nr:ADP-ribosylation factor-related protein 1 isoform X4 [Mesoplodon densirostris]